MKLLALTLAAGVALTGAAATAQAHEWGGGYGYGYGPRTHSRVIVREGYRDGYRGVGLHRGWDRPAVRVIERRGHGYGYGYGRRGWDD